MSNNKRSAESIKRAVDVLVGMYACDAATVPVHWIYDNKALKETLGGKWDTPEFFGTMSCPFYNSKDFPGHYEPGMPSPYCEEALALLDYMEKEKGSFNDPNDFAQSLYEWAKSYDGRKNGNTKGFEANMDALTKDKATEFYPKCGADDAEANAFFKVPALVLRYGDDKEVMLKKVEEAVRTHQNKEPTAEFSQAQALMLLSLNNGASLEEAFLAGSEAGPAAKKAIDIAIGAKATSVEETAHDEVIKFVGDFSESLWAPPTPEHFKRMGAFSCAFPGSLTVASKLAMDAELNAKREGVSNVLVSAIRRNIQVGGDQCGRAAFISSLLIASGAQVPAEWLDQTSTVERVTKVAEVIKAAI